MTTRVFTVEVTGCKNCPCAYMSYCYHPSLAEERYSIYQRSDVFYDNKDAITESCPMYRNSFVKDEKK